MYELEVMVLDDPHIVSTPGELAAVMASRRDGGNHFEIAGVAKPFPLLDVLVRDPYAVIHFFSSEDVAGDQADSSVADAPDEAEFPHSGLGDTITMPGSVLVDLATAIACVGQFGETLARPTVVDWIEL